MPRRPVRRGIRRLRRRPRPWHPSPAAAVRSVSPVAC